MSSDLVIVYHRQPYEEVKENGKTVFRENKSPNGIVPTLKSFFGGATHGAWVAWKLAEDPDNPDFEERIEMIMGITRFPACRFLPSKFVNFIMSPLKKRSGRSCTASRSVTIMTPLTGRTTGR